MTGAACLLLIAVAAAIRGIWSPCGLSMISAINPMAERARGHRYWLTAAWLVAGAVVGGVLLGATGAVGALLLRPILPGPVGAASLAALCCLVAVASDTSVLGLQLPLHPRQVNERWLGQYRRWVYAAGFGAQIGSGLATYIMTAAVYLVPALGAVSGSPALALVAGLVFGLVRGLAVLISARATDPAALGRLHRRLDLLGPWSSRVAIGVELLAAGLFAAGAFGVFGPAVGLIAVAGLLLARGRWPRTRSASDSPSDVQVPHL